MAASPNLMYAYMLTVTCRAHLGLLGAQVGPIAEVPYLKRCAVAHQLHHSEKYGGVPWGMFLGPQELEAVGAKEELDKLCQELQFRTKK